jgi:hypothetical protein
MTLLNSARVRWAAALAIPILVGVLAIYLTRPGVGLPGTQEGTNRGPGGPDPIGSTEIRTVLNPDEIPALDQPAFMAPSKAGFVPASAQVMGVTFGDESHAYLVSALSRHEIVNDRVGGRNIAVTW